MPKITIPGLASFPPGLGFGSSVIPPDLPRIADLYSANLYGTAFAGVEDDGPISFISAISGLPTGLAVDAAGLRMNGNLASGTTTVLQGIREPWEGTFFALLDLPGTTVGTSNTGQIIGSTGTPNRMTLTPRWHNQFGSPSTVGPWTHLHSVSGQITRGAPNDAQGTNTSGSHTATTLRLDRPILYALIKDVTSGEYRAHLIQDDTLTTATGPVTYGDPAQSTIITFGAHGANISGPNTLHAVGSYDAILTPAEIMDLYQGLMHTRASALATG